MRKTTTTIFATLCAATLTACGGDAGTETESRTASKVSESTVVTSDQFIEACTTYYAEAPTGRLTSSGTRVKNTLRETIVERGPRQFCECIDSNMGPVLAKLTGRVNDLATDVDFDESGPTARLILKTREDAITYYPARLKFDREEENYTARGRIENAPRGGSMISQVTDACEKPLREELYD